MGGIIRMSAIATSTLKNYELAICELVHPKLHHGIEEDVKESNEFKNSIFNHFLIYCTFSPSEFFDRSYKEEEKRVQRYRRRENNMLHLSETHPTLRKYNQNYIRLEIIQYCKVRTEEDGYNYHIGILKTFWLRIVQRCWKKVFKMRQDIVRQRSSIKALQERQRTGQYPLHLREWPVFRLNLTN